MVASSSVAPAPTLNLVDQIDTDFGIKTDSIVNLGTALLGMVDQKAYREFYLGLVAEGLNDAAIAHAVAALGPVSTAIVADFVKKLSGQSLLPAPEGINLKSTVTAIGARGVAYGYSVAQEINGVAVNLNLALRFKDQRPTLAALIDGRTGYNIFLDGLELVITDLSLASGEVNVKLLPAAGAITGFSASQLVAEVEVSAGGNAIEGVAFNGESLSVGMPLGTLVNGIIGVNATVGGTLKTVSATLDLVSGSSAITVAQPNIKVEMEGVRLP